ncbi:MAG: AbrB/MazE/SpoVT family DNA-binding domain-containing protein [Verrucomicrobiota bacterium]
MQNLLRKTARIFRNGSNQAIRIPREMEFEETEVLLEKRGTDVLIKPVPKAQGLIDYLSEVEPIEEDLIIEDDSFHPRDEIHLI